MKVNRLYFFYWKTAFVVGIVAAVMSIAVCARSQGCPSISIQNLSTSANLTRYGFAELCNPSTPPKRYLTSTSYDHRMYSDTMDVYEPGYYFDLYSTGHHMNSIDTTVITYISPIDGSSSNNCSGNVVDDQLDCYQFYYPDGSSDTNDSFTWSDSSSATLVNCIWSDGGTLAYAETTGFIGYDGYNPPSGITAVGNCAATAQSSSWSTADNNYLILRTGGNTLNVREANFTTTLDAENSDSVLRASLISLMPPYPTTTNWPGGSGTAFFSFSDTNHLLASGGKMKYRFKITGYQPKQTYSFTWIEQTTTTIGTNTVSTNTVMGPVEVTPTGDPSQPYYYPNADGIPVDMPSNPCSITELSPSTPTPVPPKPPGNGSK